MGSLGKQSPVEAQRPMVVTRSLADGTDSHPIELFEPAG